MALPVPIPTKARQQKLRLRQDVLDRARVLAKRLDVTLNAIVNLALEYHLVEKAPLKKYPQHWWVGRQALTVRIKPEVLDRGRAHAGQSGVALNTIMNAALENYVNAVEQQRARE